MDTSHNLAEVYGMSNDEWRYTPMTLNEIYGIDDVEIDDDVEEDDEQDYYFTYVFQIKEILILNTRYRAVIRYKENKPDNYEYAVITSRIKNKFWTQYRSPTDPEVVLGILSDYKIYYGEFASVELNVTWIDKNDFYTISIDEYETVNIYKKVNNYINYNDVNTIKN